MRVGECEYGGGCVCERVCVRVGERVRERVSVCVSVCGGTVTEETKELGRRTAWRLTVTGSGR